MGGRSVNREILIFFGHGGGGTKPPFISVVSVLLSICSGVAPSGWLPGKGEASRIHGSDSIALDLSKGTGSMAVGWTVMDLRAAFLNWPRMSWLVFRSGMFGRKRNKEEHRYYLLPGMGRANKRKRVVFFRWALAVGFFVSLLVGYFIYRANRIGL
ncbi:MAG: hypothetical protein M2R45_02621 [Verrucomicrobia subdivision 3 bacterium]|nr:hypothetical protein [Limisphaerales bacterium]MCS1416411.1 hypothetical protein [Limisphaerales bacterium]